MLDFAAGFFFTFYFAMHLKEYFVLFLWKTTGIAETFAVMFVGK